MLMDESVRDLIRRRAGNRCEYCRLPQEAVDAKFHVDHIVARQHVDEAADDPDALALACDRGNFCKGTNLSSIAPDAGKVVALFNPRCNTWSEHFAMNGPEIIGLTPTGRAILRLLQMNARHRVELREWIIDQSFMG